jgi:carbon dioxide concentrating mechanism protein CcmN
MTELVEVTSSQNHPTTGGQVMVAAGVAQASNVILGAAPGCRLVISAGVCLGSDVIVQASRGDLVIEPGANLGSGVLVVGRGRIGPHACIGANSTLIDPNLKTGQVIPPNSLVGDPHHSSDSGSGTAQREHPLAVAFSSPAAPPLSASPTAPTSYVYGQKQVQQLLETLFPHRQALNGVAPENKP